MDGAEHARLSPIAKQLRITAKLHDLGVDKEPPDDELIGRAVPS